MPCHKRTIVLADKTSVTEKLSREVISPLENANFGLQNLLPTPDFHYNLVSTGWQIRFESEFRRTEVRLSLHSRTTLIGV